MKLSSYTFCGKKCFISSPKILLLVFLRAFFIAAYFYLAGFSLLTPNISHFLTTEIKLLCFFSPQNSWFCPENSVNSGALSSYCIMNRTHDHRTWVASNNCSKACCTCVDQYLSVYSQYASHHMAAHHGHIVQWLEGTTCNWKIMSLFLLESLNFFRAFLHVFNYLYITVISFLKQTTNMYTCNALIFYLTGTTYRM